MENIEKKNFLNVKDVCEYMNISQRMAYKIIHQLNDELSAKGYITVSGRVSRAYFEEKIYAGRAA